MECHLTSFLVLGNALYAPKECLYWALVIASAAAPASGIWVPQFSLLLVPSSRHENSQAVWIMVNVQEVHAANHAWSHLPALVSFLCQWLSKFAH